MCPVWSSAGSGSICVSLSTGVRREKQFWGESFKMRCSGLHTPPPAFLPTRLQSEGSNETLWSLRVRSPFPRARGHVGRDYLMSNPLKKHVMGLLSFQPTAVTWWVRYWGRKKKKLWFPDLDHSEQQVNHGKWLFFGCHLFNVSP